MRMRTKKTSGAAAKQGAAPATPAAGKPQRAAAGVPSLISAGVVLKGSLVSDGEVQFDGVIEGDIRAAHLVIGEGASVIGEVVAERASISGRVKGVVRAGRVDLSASAVIEGDVLHAALTVETGARLDGKVCCVEDPLRGARAGTEAPAPRKRPRADAPDAGPVREVATKAA